MILTQSYIPGASATSLGQQWDLAYGIGNGGFSAKADVYQDEVNVGGVQSKAVVVGRLSDGSTLDLGTADALFGLGGTHPHGDSTPAFIESLYSGGGWPDYTFTLDLTPSGGSMSIGPAPGGLAWVELDGRANGDWLVRGSVGSVGVGSVGFTAFVDSGSSYIMLPATSLESIAKEAGLSTYSDGGDTIYMYGDCSSNPKIAFTFGSAHVELSQASLWSGGVPPESIQAPANNCVAGFAGLKSLQEGESWLLGEYWATGWNRRSRSEE